MEKFQSLVSRLEKGALPKEEFGLCVKRAKKSYEIDIDLELLNFYGLPVEEDDEAVYLKTQKNNFKDEVYCIVDIETNGSSPVKNQIIEIGAVKYKRGEVIDKFSSFVYADFIPESIVRLTNIEQSDLKDAPSLKKVLHDFKLFLGDCVFVAHNVKFDYCFISKSLQTVGVDELLNRKLCTVDLSRKTIEAERHGLGYLREHLSIEAGEHHRAYSDALSAAKVLDACFKNIPEYVNTTEELIKFSHGGNQKKKKKPKGKIEKVEVKKES
jgi:DNA polymerase-3 subunit epsilon